MLASGSRSGLRRSSKTAFTMRTFINRPSAREPRLVTSSLMNHVFPRNVTRVRGVTGSGSARHRRLSWSSLAAPADSFGKVVAKAAKPRRTGSGAAARRRANSASRTSRPAARHSPAACAAIASSYAPSAGSNACGASADPGDRRLGVGPRAGPGAVAVAVQVDRVGDPERRAKSNPARSADTAARWPSKGPSRPARRRSPPGRRRGAGAGASRRPSPSRRPARDRSGPLGP